MAIITISVFNAGSWADWQRLCRPSQRLARGGFQNRRLPVLVTGQGRRQDAEQRPLLTLAEPALLWCRRVSVEPRLQEAYLVPKNAVTVSFQRFQTNGKC